MSTCTTPDCGMEANNYICNQCTQDLQAWIDKCAEILPELDDTIARLDNVRAGSNEGGNGTKTAGSKAPLNLEAMQLKINLASITENAEHYAKDQFAAGIAQTIQDWYTKAELLVSGPEEEHIDHQTNKERVKEIAPPMPTRKLIPWLREHAKLSLTSQIIRHYVHKGYLHAVEREPQPTYHPHEVINVYNNHGKEAQ